MATFKVTGSNGRAIFMETRRASVRTTIANPRGSGHGLYRDTRNSHRVSPTDQGHEIVPINPPRVIHDMRRSLFPKDGLKVALLPAMERSSSLCAQCTDDSCKLNHATLRLDEIISHVGSSGIIYMFTVLFDVRDWSVRSG